LEHEVCTDNGPRLIDTLASPTRSQEDQYVSQEEHALISRLLGSAIARLDRRERFVLQASLMCDDDETLSLAEIGRRLVVSRERTRQLSSRALRKIRRQLVSGLGTAELESLSA
jgi:RNA polymerase sigma-32 factor